MSVMRSHGFCRNPTGMDTDITYFCGMKTNVAGTPAGMQKKCRNEDTFSHTADAMRTSGTSSNGVREGTPTTFPNYKIT